MTTDIKIFDDGPPPPYIIRPCCGRQPNMERLINTFRIACPCSRRTGWHRQMEAAVLEWSTFDLMGEEGNV